MKRTQAIELPEEEIAKQKEWMAAFAALEDRPHTYCVVTYGCQMNAHDSEKLEGMLTQMGMTPAANREEADFVIFNTCCVRDNAQRRALGNVVWLKELKKTRPELMVGVCGCMMQQPGMGEQILKQYPFVDLAFGTHNLYRFAQLMLKAVQSRRRVVEVIQDDEGSIPEDLPVRRSSPASVRHRRLAFHPKNGTSLLPVPVRKRPTGSRDKIPPHLYCGLAGAVPAKKHHWC